MKKIKYSQDYRDKIRMMKKDLDTRFDKDVRLAVFKNLFQLAQSSYGYKEYLVTKTQNRDALLDFGFWRTGICREIYQKAKDISKTLTNDF